jgi:PIN domain nuclease of toxin-antitoxin system
VKLLLDAHALIWAVDDPKRLGLKSLMAVRDPANQLLLSAGTIWEIAIEVGLGKLSLSMPVRQWLTRCIDDLGLSVLPITIEYADVQATLPNHHRDPFDRLLVAQAKVDSLFIISSDSVFDRYGVACIWD